MDWKESFLDRKEHIFDTDQVEMRKYNARDCTALIDIYENMMVDIKLSKLEPIVELEHKLIPPIAIMKERGISKDLSKLKTWQAWITKELNQSESTLRKDYNLPAEFNFNSQDHMNWILYGFQTPGLKKKMKELKSYETEEQSVQYECRECLSKKSFKYPSLGLVPATTEAKCSKCRQNMPFFRTSLDPKPVKARSRETKKYKELESSAALFECVPFAKPSAFRPARTSSGKYGTGREDISRFENAVLARQRQLDDQKRPSPDEITGLERTSDFLGRFTELTKFSKLKTSFFDLPVGKDGRIHPTVLIQGTATGRFSCINPNAQWALLNPVNSGKAEMPILSQAA